MAGRNQRMNFAEKPFDNCLLLYQLSFQEFFYSFWSGQTLHKLLDPELPMGRKIEMMFPLLLSSVEHYPEELRWSAWGPICTPEEQYIFFRISLRFLFVYFSNISAAGLLDKVVPVLLCEYGLRAIPRRKLLSNGVR